MASPPSCRVLLQAAYQTRDVVHISSATAAAANAGLAKLLKASIRQQRPSATCALLGVCETYGMPSNHATMMSFAAVQWVLWHSRARQSSTSGAIWLGLDVLVFGILVFLVSYARVYLGYHSVSQVVAGIACGSSTALLCSALEQRFIVPYAHRLAQSQLGRTLALRAAPRSDRTKLP